MHTHVIILSVFFSGSFPGCSSSYSFGYSFGCSSGILIATYTYGIILRTFWVRLRQYLRFDLIIGRIFPAIYYFCDQFSAIRTSPYDLCFLRSEPALYSIFLRSEPALMTVNIYIIEIPVVCCQIYNTFDQTDDSHHNTTDPECQN